ncbi:MAG: glycosyltransferase [Patescibacteria group bacterium]|jgi:glycosyltransferase involved in cell wall biosynthesis
MSKSRFSFVGKIGRTTRNLLSKFGLRQSWQLLFGQTAAPDWSALERLQAAVDWLINAFGATGGQGFSAYYSLLSGWGKSYAETTGYIIPTLLKFSREFDYRQAEIKKICTTSGEWLLTVQHADGSFSGYDNDVPVIFNTGQVVVGLMELYRLTNDVRYLQAAQRAGDWLVINQEADGSWIKYAYNGIKHAYNSLVDWPLVELSKLTGQADYMAAAVKNLDWVLVEQQANGWFNYFGFTDEPKSVLHTIGYTLQGLIEAGNSLGQTKYIAAAKRTADYLTDLNDRQILFSFYNTNWQSASYSRCLTGLAQMGIVWERLAELYPEESSRYRTAAQKVWNYLVEHQITTLPHAEIRGSLPGSAPIWGDYLPLAFPNWGVKFFIDLGLLLYAKQIPIYSQNYPAPVQSKHVLVVSCFFPPLQVVVSTMISNLIKYLPRFGWQPLVVAAQSSREFKLDLESLQQVPLNLPVYRTKVWENIFTRAMNRLGLVSDSMFGWWGSAVRAAKYLHRRRHISAIISRSNPITSHLVAWWLTRYVMPGTPWLAIFGDPWVNNPYRQQRHYWPLIQKWQTYLERGILHSATKIIVTTESTKSFLVDWPKWQSKTEVLPHVFDDQSKFNLPMANPSDRKILKATFAGNFYGVRSPEPLFKALKLLKENDPEVFTHLEINLWGKLSPFEYLLQTYGIENNVIYHGEAPRSRILSELATSDLLILIDAPSVSESIFLPAKLMDYLAVRRPILGITPVGESARLIQSTKTGTAVSPDDVSGIAAALRSYYQSFCQQQLIFQSDEIELSKYHATAAAQKLAEWLDQLIPDRLH